MWPKASDLTNSQVRLTLTKTNWMTEQEALAAARAAAALDQFREGWHGTRQPYQMGLSRNQWREVTRDDIRRALKTATSAVCEGGDKWRFSGGQDLDDEELVVVFIVTPPGKVVTTY